MFNLSSIDSLDVTFVLFLLALALSFTYLLVKWAFKTSSEEEVSVPLKEKTPADLAVLGLSSQLEADMFKTPSSDEVFMRTSSPHPVPTTPQSPEEWVKFWNAVESNPTPDLAMLNVNSDSWYGLLSEDGLDLYFGDTVKKFKTTPQQKKELKKMITKLHPKKKSKKKSKKTLTKTKKTVTKKK